VEQRKPMTRFRTCIAAILGFSACVPDFVIGGPGEAATPVDCEPSHRQFAGNAPLRRLTRFEYNQTIRDLFGDDTSPANALPSEEIGNGFGNDAESQVVSSLLAEQYAIVAEGIATRVTASPEALARLSSCAPQIVEGTDPAVERECADRVLAILARRAYRRPVEVAEVDALIDLQRTLREGATFRSSIAATIEAVLQSPDFLYRVERGFVDSDGRRRPNGYEMASRLSYLLWGSMPDDDLFAAAESGELVNHEGILAHAERMFDDPRSRVVTRFFFDNLLPIGGLAELERSEDRFPTYSAEVGALLREETQTFLAYELHESSGSWKTVLTAPYTFVNEDLAAFYGIPDIEGDEFRQVSLDPERRLGLLTHAGVVAGPIHSNDTNPVVRGSFIVQRLLCETIPPPTGDILAQVKPPDPDSGATARERFTQHREDPVCMACHQRMDPVGLALENYDAVGLWRDRENGLRIDSSGQIPDSGVPVDGPVELVQAIADDPRTYECFARHWANFAYGRTLEDDACGLSQLQDDFVASDYDVRELMLGLTQTDAFLYLPEEPSESP